MHVQAASVAHSIESIHYLIAAMPRFIMLLCVALTYLDMLAAKFTHLLLLSYITAWADSHTVHFIPDTSTVMLLYS